MLEAHTSIAKLYNYFFIKIGKSKIDVLQPAIAEI